MLNHIRGTVASASEQRLTLDIGPLGVMLHVPDEREFRVGQAALVFAHLHWSQENGPTLFGFATELDRTVFLLITSCSGLGPKIALAVLSKLGAKAFFDAVCKGDESALSNVSGIGPKKAEQMIVQLKHKVEKLVKGGVELGDGARALEHWQNVSDVLVSLNYTRTEITRTMKHLNEQNSDNSDIPFDRLIRQALSFLSKKA